MDPSLTYTVDVAKLTQLAPGLPREAIRVATLFDGKRKLWEVLRDSFLTSRMTMSIFSRLKDLELVGTAPVEVVSEPTPEPEPVPEPAQEPLVAEEPEQPEEPEDISELATTIRIPVMTVVAPEEQDILPATPETVVYEAPVHEPILEAAPAPEIHAAPAPVVPPVLEVAVAQDPVDSPPPAAAREDFDEADRAFFDSYEPEDSSVDTFWDLEDNPRKQRAARLLQKRLNRRSRGWFASLLLT